jgi:hypothetical protein
MRRRLRRDRVANGGLPQGDLAARTEQSTLPTIDEPPPQGWPANSDEPTAPSERFDQAGFKPTKRGVRDEDRLGPQYAPTS